MSVKIHYGPPGSYKTAGAMLDDVIPALREGRLVVTNVRGLTIEKVRREFPDLPGEAEVLSLDTEEAGQKERWSRWFHWVPQGALMVVDEAQDVWPKRWTDKQLQALEFPGGEDAAEKEGRPGTWWIAWEKHRHYNWDFVLTAPHIKKIREEIREVSEGAFKHINRAQLGRIFAGSYNQAYHSAMDTGSASSIYTVEKKRIPDYVFRCYKSTKTGEFTDTQAGTSIFADGRVLWGGLGALALLGYSVYSVFISDSGFYGRRHNSGAVEVAVEDNPVGVGADRLAPGDLGWVPYSAGGDRASDGIGPLTHQHVVISGSADLLGRQKTWLLVGDPGEGQGWQIEAGELRSLGYEYRRLSGCVGELWRGGQKQVVYCDDWREAGYTAALAQRKSGASSGDAGSPQTRSSGRVGR